MKELFRVKDLIFYREEFLDDISEFEDLIPIIEEFSEGLDYEEIQCVDLNDCCGKSKMNYIVQINGFLNEDDDFITMEEVEQDNTVDREKLSLFVIRVYMCTECKKWIIDILEQ